MNNILTAIKIQQYLIYLPSINSAVVYLSPPFIKLYQLFFGFWV